MAAASATSGMATKTPTRKRWNAEFGSSSRSGRIGRSVVLVAPPMVPADAGVVGEVARSAVAAASRAGAMVASAALPGSGDRVIRPPRNPGKRKERVYTYVTRPYQPR